MCFQYLRSEQDIPLLRILTGRGTEYCGKAEYYEYERYVTMENVERSKTKSRVRKAMGICARFHRTIHNEFYAIAFRKKLYDSLEALKPDLDQWIAEYNEQRTHSGKYCFGRTP